MALGGIERVYKVVVDGTEAVRQLEKLNTSVSAIDTKMSEFASSLKKAGAALASFEVAKQIVQGIGQVIDSIDQLSDDAQKIGVTTDELQRLRYAATFGGQAAEVMDKAIAGLASNIAHLGVATDETAQVLKSMGVTSGDSPSAALEKIAARFESLPDGVEKTAEAIAIFGKKVGPEMVPFLNQGAEGIAKLMKEAEKFGGILSAGVIDQAGKFNDNMDKLKLTLAGVGKQFAAGLLPGLQAVTKFLTEVTKTGDGFKSWGEATGDALVKVTVGMIYLSNAAQKAFYTTEALFKLRLKPGAAIDIVGQWWKDIKSIQEAGPQVQKLLDAFRQARLDAAKPPDPPKKGGETDEDRLARLAREAEAARQRQLEFDRGAAAAMKADAEEEKAAGDEHVKQLEKILDLTLEQTQALEDQKQAQVGIDAARAAGAVPPTAAMEKYREAFNEQTDAAIAARDAQEKLNTNMQVWNDMLKSSDESIRKYAQSMIDATNAANAHGSELGIVTDSFANFFMTMRNGTADASEAFKRMIESMIAELLRLWAQKYILSAFSKAFTGGAGGGGLNDTGAWGPGTNALGNAFAGGRVIPFATGGIVGGPVLMPLALMGEAGPEAVLPLRRGPDGALGVRGGAGALNVAIHNHTDAKVSARRDGNGDLQVIIEQTKRAVATDIARGGTDIARAAEAAWRLSRGAAAAF